ncbi:hypothetical protein HFN_1317 [Helicobacter fennelliae MRY12-0050]|uniref:Uncharacterized protein n=1 Tax=Helicobacter fennelliae MRY12-0050 TaxID=1325130 RepID=T1DWZ7_9HELI|nr:hypothetical protein HFN_1317 [Helicobacter fennelliae MRY12-0050]
MDIDKYFLTFLYFDTFCDSFCFVWDKHTNKLKIPNNLYAL